MKTTIKILVFALMAAFFTGTADAQTYATVTGNGVRIRAYPSFSGTILTKVYKGTRVTVDYNRGTNAGWTPVIWNGYYGYINNEFLSFRSSSSSPSYTYATVTGDGVRVRASASLSAKILTKVYRGSRVRIDTSRYSANGFTPVIANGYRGYIATEYLYW